MESTISWLDTTTEQQENTLDLLDKFRRRDTRDELGFGRIRDSFSNLFFPGTSTIQTRVRYFLFIPWIYAEVQQRDPPPDEFPDTIRRYEQRLIRGLLRGGEAEGVIGREAKEDLSRMPSTIYWGGLRSWDILRFNGSKSEYHARIRRNKTSGSDVRTLLESNSAIQESAWHKGLPDAPESFPQEASFNLRETEANYLHDRIIESHPDSLLARLLRLGEPLPNVDFPWEAPQFTDLSDRHQVYLLHAQNFSEISHGAVLLYNLMLAEKSEADDLQQEYMTDLSEWREMITARNTAFQDWSLNEFWSIVEQTAGQIPQRTRSFVTEWIKIIRENPTELWDQSEARRLISRRELQLKGRRARLHHADALRLWNDGAGLGRLGYRWPVARSHLNDIISNMEVR
ncbi:DUF6361 family protein [Natronomonas gomsonensis]|uniref:DUF6361 family protein n=1 Tax=Natronomonas gomsonensis TaxID=1046043 RepID=UPI0015BC430B|nr:DUF6361 family protein [Natronomonas gomsonensis]